MIASVPESLPVEKRILSNVKMYALTVIEQNRDSLVQNELQQAEQQLRVAQNNLEMAKKGLAEVQGAIIGANVMIERELALDGFTVEDWESIKKAQQAESEQKQEEPESPESASDEAPVLEETVPVAPAAKINHLKRRRR